MSDIVLRKGRLSSAFWGRFRDYYLNMPGVDPSYTDGRWRQWKESPDLITYLARKEGKVAGWIVPPELLSATAAAPDVISLADRPPSAIGPPPGVGSARSTCDCGAPSR